QDEVHQRRCHRLLTRGRRAPSSRSRFAPATRDGCKNPCARRKAVWWDTMSSRLSGTALVVDDDLTLGMVLASQLKQAGIDARRVSSAEEALKAFAASPFDAVLTDLRMPGRDGLSLLREMKQIAPDVPIVMLTAHGTIPVAVEAMKAGAADFLTKP